MPLYRPTELLAFLEEQGLRAKKSLSQNFLIDGNIVDHIVDRVRLQPGDIVLEIGPGPGVLTEALLKRGAIVHAIEKDRKFAELLRRLDPAGKQLFIYEDDALTFDIEKFQKSIFPKKAKLAANLPYNITTPILTRYVKERGCFDSLTVMVQSEVADRLTSPPGSKEFGSITVFLNFFSDVHYCFKVKKQSFIPAPKVDSAVIHMDLKKPPILLEASQELFLKMVRTGFMGRRKMLKTSLKKVFPDIDFAAILKKNQIDEKVRPEDLGLPQYLAIFHSFAASEKPEGRQSNQ